VSRGLPLIPTIIVGIAAAIMVALGFWQIERAREKEALLARYAAAQQLPPVSFPTIPAAEKDLPLFRRATATCFNPKPHRVAGGRNRAGENGYVQIVACGAASQGPGIFVELGWSRDPAAKFHWRGGPVEGVIAPDSQNRLRLIASEPPKGLQASAPPSLETIPNSHRFYVVQWFLFAALAVLIYGLAVRKRMKDAAAEPVREPTP
jgi:cytochrome oxidase assembly protein ShyY1